MKIINESTVPDEFNNFRIDKYLALRFDYMSRSRWQKEISDGRVLCNGKPLTGHNKKVKAGDIIKYQGQDIKEPEVSKDYSILYEDEFLIAINKPGNLPVHPAGKFFHNTLTSILKEDLGLKLYPVHRLDRDTSGVILMAKNSAITAEIQKKFHEVEKTYIAIVHGRVKEREFRVDLPIGPHRSSPVRKRREAYIGAEESAATRFRRLALFDGYSLVKAELETGRLHQIRVHLNAAGYPILGDKIYGLDDRFYLEFIENGNTPELLEKTGFPRCALHSRSILFFHPRLGKKIYIKSAMPNEFRDFIALHRAPCSS